MKEILVHIAKFIPVCFISVLLGVLSAEVAKLNGLDETTSLMISMAITFFSVMSIDVIKSCH